MHSSPFDSTCYHFPNSEAMPLSSESDSVLFLDRLKNTAHFAEAAGQMERISDDVAKLTKTQVGTETAMWASFQPLYDLMLEKDDSFLN